MLVGLFEKTTTKPLDSLGRGIVASGDSLLYQNHNYFDPDNTPEFDAVVVHGLQWKSRKIADYYKAQGTPVAVVEQGHIKRGEYWQFNPYGDLNWVPDSAPNDRRLALGITEIPERVPPKDGYVLVLGQKSGDAQHPFEDFAVWAEQLLTEPWVVCAPQRIVFRIHPMERGRKPIGFDEYHFPLDWTLGASLAGADCVVTYNSNAGLTAILQGVPVLADDCAPYSDADLRQCMADRLWALDRIAYAQWNIPEFESGEAWRFVRKHMMESLNANNETPETAVA